MNNTTDTTQRLAVSVDEAAHMIGLSTRTIQYMIATGELPSVKVRARRLIPVSALRKLFSEETPAFQARDLDNQQHETGCENDNR